MRKPFTALLVLCVSVLTIAGCASDDVAADDYGGEVKTAPNADVSSGGGESKKGTPPVAEP
ncbi:hypothetical protein QPK87_28465 [Kamptonema cortianum]|nr:hypothetical protein [Geitlerinema splendidum]MDK3160460.1 hypothetical protein [Kamptonema cortianum]